MSGTGQHHVAIEWLARIGYAARGIVFLVLGYFTAVAAFEARRPVDTKDALKTLLTQPLGDFLLFLVAAGLLCFACWRAAQSIFDADRCGSDPSGLWRRFVYGAAAVFYVAFAVAAFSMIFGYSHDSSDVQVRDWTAWLLGKPSGSWLVLAVGVAVMAGGIGTAVGGLRAEFKARLDLAHRPRWFVTLLGTAGYLARALVLTIVGLFLVFAAIDANSRESTGFAGALSIIQGQSYGTILLAGTAAGFVAFGLFGLAQAAFRRVEPSRSWMHI